MSAPRLLVPEWWQEIAAVAESEGHDRYSAAWYRRYRALYRERFPNADQRSLDNIDALVRSAEAREARGTVRSWGQHKSGPGGAGNTVTPGLTPDWRG